MLAMKLIATEIIYINMEFEKQKISIDLTMIKSSHLYFYGKRQKNTKLLKIAKGL